MDSSYFSFLYFNGVVSSTTAKSSIFSVIIKELTVVTPFELIDKAFFRALSFSFSPHPTIKSASLFFLLYLPITNWLSVSVVIKPFPWAKEPFPLDSQFLPPTWLFPPRAMLFHPSAWEFSPKAALLAPSAWACASPVNVLYPSAWELGAQAIVLHPSAWVPAP